MFECCRGWVIWAWGWLVKAGWKPNTKAGSPGQARRGETGVQECSNATGAVRGVGWLKAGWKRDVQRVDLCAVGVVALERRRWERAEGRRVDPVSGGVSTRVRHDRHHAVRERGARVRVAGQRLRPIPGCRAKGTPRAGGRMFNHKKERKKGDLGLEVGRQSLRQPEA